MVRALRSSRTEILLAGWRAFLDDLVTDDEPDRPHASRPIAEIAGRRIGRVHRRMVAEGVAIRDDTPAQALHDLRKTGKELRYLLEFFAGLYSAEVVRPLIKSLKALQDVLGRFQDREVQAAELRSLRTEVAALPDGPTALLAMGLVLERLGQDQARARAEFAERFAAFADRSQQRLVRRTFR
jgi:CHAD domain-containing protein